LGGRQTHLFGMGVNRDPGECDFRVPSLSRIAEKCTFPLKSICVQWIRWTPLARLSTLSSNMSRIFLSFPRIENELFHWKLFVSNGSDGLYRNDFLPPHPAWVESFCKSQSRTENELFNWNLFVSNRSNGLAPLERHSTPWNNMSGIFLSLSRIENVFFHWNLFVCTVQWITYTW